MNGERQASWTCTAPPSPSHMASTAPSAQQEGNVAVSVPCAEVQKPRGKLDGAWSGFCAAVNWMDSVVAGITGLDQSKYALYEDDYMHQHEEKAAFRQNSKNWVPWKSNTPDDEEDLYDIEAPKPKD